MSSYTLGIDTSNYATSLAVFNTAGEVVCAKKRFLPVKEGQLGLRQSDALFHHTVALPEMLAELGSEFDLTQISAVGVSEKPRPVEGSYMPCFLAGVSAATAFAAARASALPRRSRWPGASRSSARPISRAMRRRHCLRPRVKSSSARKHCCSTFPAARPTCFFAMK